MRISLSIKLWTFHGFNRGPLLRPDNTEWEIGRRENRLDHSSIGMCCRTRDGCVD